MQVEGETTSKLFSINLNAGTTNQPQGPATLVGVVGAGEADPGDGDRPAADPVQDRELYGK